MPPIGWSLSWLIVFGNWIVPNCFQGLFKVPGQGHEFPFQNSTCLSTFLDKSQTEKVVEYIIVDRLLKQLVLREQNTWPEYLTGIWIRFDYEQIASVGICSCEGHVKILDRNMDKSLRLNSYSPGKFYFSFLQWIGNMKRIKHCSVFCYQRQHQLEQFQGSIDIQHE